MYAVVGDSYITALFIYAILKRHKSLSNFLMVQDLRALEIGVGKYIRDCHLEKMYTLTRRIHFLALSLVQEANTLYPPERNASLKLIYEEQVPRFFSFGQPMPADALLLAPCNSVEIVSPFAEIVIQPKSTAGHFAQDDHHNERFLALVAFLEALISHLGARFEGYAKQRGKREEQIADLGYFEIIHPLGGAKPMRKMDRTRFRKIGGRPSGHSRGTQNLILDADGQHLSIYKVGHVFGTCLPKLNRGKSAQVSRNVFDLVLSMIKVPGVIPKWIRDRRADTMRTYLWCELKDDLKIYMYDKGLGKEESYAVLEEMIAEHKRGKSKEHVFQVYGLPGVPETHPLLDV